MTPDDRQTPRFEPPPWEAEAFERFRSEKERVRAAEELEDALRQMTEPVSGSSVAVVITEQRPEPQQPASESVSSMVSHPANRALEDGSVPEARIEAMLAELKAQETNAPKASQTLVYGSTAFLGTSGAFMVIFAITMYVRVSPSGGPAMVLAAMASLIMLLAGVGCIAGAVVLYRKHHQ